MGHDRSGSANTPLLLHAGLFVALACWAVAALAQAVAPSEVTNGLPVALAVYWLVAVSSVMVLLCAVLHTTGATRAFWMTLAGGGFFRFAGNAGLGGLRVFDLVPPVLALNDVALCYVLSNLSCSL